MTTARYVTAWFVAVCILHGTPLWAQTGFPAQGMAAIDGLYRGVNPQDDNARRVAILRVCQQMQFALGERWGNKKRTGLSDDFISPDSIAYREDNGTISVWDIQASSGAITVDVGVPAQHPNLPTSEATLMDCVAIDHLGGGGVEPEPAPEPAPVDLQPLWTAITDLRVEFAELRAILDMLSALVTQMDARAAQDRARIEKVEARPLPLTGCRAAIAGIPISCRLQ